MYTCPSPDALLMDGDSSFVLVKPKRITRRDRRTTPRSRAGSARRRLPKKESGGNRSNSKDHRNSSSLRRGSIV